jgi:putative transposase
VLLSSSVCGISRRRIGSTKKLVGYLAAVRVRYGYRRLHVLLRREGWKINHKLVWRIYREEGLSIRMKGKKKKVSRLRVVLPEAKAPNERWSMDFLSDGLYTGRRFRVFTLDIMD